MIRRVRRKFLYACLCACLSFGVFVGCSGDTGGDSNGTSNDVSDAGDADDGGDDAVDGGDASDSGDEEEVGALHLQMYDLDGDAVEGADVALGSETEQSDEDGVATFDELDPGRVVAQIEADGFAESTAVVDIAAGITANDTVHLMETPDPISFDASDDATLYEGRVRLDVPADGLVDQDGDTYNGQAEASITPLNPSTGERAAMPGPLEGILEGDEDPTPMESVLMADIVIRDDAGEELQVADGSRLGIEFVLPDDLQDEYAEGDQVESYWYDTEEGVWKQESTGEVIESSYADGKLAWRYEAEHLTWWNCDEPWYDKNCVDVDVVDEDSGDPISGVTVKADGLTYNGVTVGQSDTNGDACVDFKLDSEVALGAEMTSGYAPVGAPQTLTGSSEPATCAGQGDGQCQQVELEMAPPTCLGGLVEDENGDPVQGAEVTGYFDAQGLQASATATTGSSGEYCLDIPQGTDVELFAQYDDGGEMLTASGDATSDTAELSCGDGSCTSADTLQLGEAGDGCISGEVVAANQNGSEPAPATNVYLFRADESTDERINIDCDADPEDWGELLASGRTDNSGSFCLEATVSADPVIPVAGRCGEHVEECVSTNPSIDLIDPGQCGEGSCTTMPEPLYIEACGTGP